MDEFGDVAALEWLLQQLRQNGDIAEQARGQLIRHAGNRLETLTRRMLRQYPRLRRWEQTADVFQNAVLRLHRALETVRPESIGQFYGLAATQIRRELIDLARHHFGPLGPAARHHSDGGNELAHAATPAERTGEPATLGEWTEFHEMVQQLPDDERTVFDLLWYEGLSQVEAAKVLSVSDRTIKSRWRNAKIHLKSLLDGELP